MKIEVGVGGYIAGIVLCVAGAALGVTAGFRLYHQFVDMQRVVIPGKSTVHLPAGESTIYAESRSVIDGMTYVSTSGTLRCAARTADGTQIPIESASGSATYAVGRYAGQ